MARDFNGVNQTLSNLNGVAGIDVVQRTIAMWVFLDAASAQMALFAPGIDLSAGNFREYVHVRIIASTARLGYYYSWTTSTATWHGNTVLSTDVWTHVLLTYDRGSTANDPQLFVDGVGQSITEVVSPSGSVNTGQDSVRVGSTMPATAEFFNGKLAEIGHWNRILTAGEIAALGKGYSPSILPRGLVAYWPLMGVHSPEMERRQGANLTLNNTPAAFAHPRMIYPRAPLTHRFTTAVGGEGPLVGGKLIRGGILMRGRLVG